MQFRKRALRFSFVFLAFIIFLFLFSVKLILIQVYQADHLAGLAEKQHNHSIELEPLRGTIYDRNYRPLAMNISVQSLYANPKIMTEIDKEKAVAELSSLLNMDSAFLNERLNRNKYFVWLKRKLPLEMVEKIKGINIKGLDFINESKRYYPNGQLAAHIIGFADIDNRGLEGVELFYDKYLKGEAGRALILRDAHQRELLLERDFISPKNGQHLILTIDETIQYIVERAIDKAYVKHKAKAVSVIVLDTKTGEILALANRPSYNLERVEESTLESRTNRAISYVYEPGSVFKIVTAAAALEEEKFIESDEIFCENGRYRIANHTLTDYRPHGRLTVREVFEVSSNIGVVKIAQALGPHLIYKYGERFQFGRTTGIDLKGEVGGWLKKPSLWSKTTIGAIPIGYEVTVTPLQLASAVAAIANDGIYMRPHLLKYIQDDQGQIIKSVEPEVIDRVVSEDTARRVKEILSGVVKDGTGRRAKIKNIKVAGKTGTAHKVINGAYADKQYYASFIGFAPADNPQIAAAVVIDDPRPRYFGGTVAAPVFREIIENSLNYLEISKTKRPNRYSRK